MNFSNLNIELIEEQIRLYETNIQGLRARVNNLSESGEDTHLEVLSDQVRDFHVYLPIIMAMGNKDLKAKHWEIYQKKVHPRFSSMNFITNEIVFLNALEHKDLIIEVSQKATGESTIYNQITNIHRKWEELQFNVAEVEEGGSSFKLSQIEEVI